MKNNFLVKNPVDKSGMWNVIIHRLAMGYVIFVFPSILVYAGLLWLAHLEGKRLLESLLPSVIVFFLLYLLYLIRPMRFIRFWGDKSANPHKKDIMR